MFIDNPCYHCYMEYYIYNGSEIKCLTRPCEHEFETKICPFCKKEYKENTPSCKECQKKNTEAVFKAGNMVFREYSKYLGQPPISIPIEGGEKLADEQIRECIQKDADNTIRILKEMLKESENIEED